MFKAFFLWFQFCAGILLVAESVWHLEMTSRERTARDWWGLAVALAIITIAALEIFFIAYRWLPDAVLWPTFVVLDVVAIFLFMTREKLPWEG